MNEKTATYTWNYADSMIVGGIFLAAFEAIAKMEDAGELTDATREKVARAKEIYIGLCEIQAEAFEDEIRADIERERQTADPAEQLAAMLKAMGVEVHVVDLGAVAPENKRAEVPPVFVDGRFVA